MNHTGAELLARFSQADIDAARLAASDASMSACNPSDEDWRECIHCGGLALIRAYAVEGRCGRCRAVCGRGDCDEADEP